ncbi:MAG TPA: outer membrane protein assembly factor BamD, partial [Flavobacteriales bacterium]|nr:outer membrane protein assembly factor BamD [Flavobacteriales bacterium]
MKLKHSLITGLISILLLSACSEYGKVLKSSDSGLK